MLRCSGLVEPDVVLRPMISRSLIGEVRHRWLTGALVTPPDPQQDKCVDLRLEDSCRRSYPPIPARTWESSDRSCCLV